MLSEPSRRLTPSGTFWILLIAGLTLRCVALTRPLVDAHLLRQCQTAAAVSDMAASPGFALSSHIPWIGDHAQSYVQELPIYNFLAMGVSAATGNLTLSGKLVSVALWAISFLLLQPIWRRMLDAAAIPWANLLFVVAPLGVFFGQAFMPETLVQVLAFGFVLLLVRYDAKPTLPRWIACVATGFLGLLVKAPEVAHLYLILVALIVRRSGWPALFRPRHVIAGILSAAGVLAWSRYLNSVNANSYAFGSTESNLVGFIGPLASRFRLQPWLMIAMYLGVFVAPGPVIFAVVQGARKLAARPAFLLLAWLGATAFFYLLWFGNTAAVQSYYNLPALAPVCALFGIGLASTLAHRSRAWMVAAAAFVVACAVPGTVYLFRPDRTILAAAEWTHAHTEPGSLILVHAAHRPDMQDYWPNAVFPFYTQRPTFIWAASMPADMRDDAIARSRYAVVTLPPPEEKIATMIRKFRGMPKPPRPSVEWLVERGFAPFAEDAGFVVFRRQ